MIAATRTKRRRPLDPEHKAWLATGLTFVAGFVDALGFLELLEVYTANMSGNTIALGLNLRRGSAYELLVRGLPILVFMLGLLVASLLVEGAQRRRFSRAASVSFAVEAALLGLYLALTAVVPGALGSGVARPFIFVLIAILSLAMGLQNGTLTHVGAATIRTTHVTGTLVELVEGLADYLYWASDRLRRGGRGRLRRMIRVTPRQPPFRRMVLMTALWVGYVAGAICAAEAHVAWHSSALLLPIGLLLVFAGVDLVRPILAGRWRRAL